METIKNLLENAKKVISYRAKALLHGHSGTVVKVENLGPYDPKTLEYRIYGKDDYGNFPPQITFRNPLGKLVTRIPRPVLEKTYDPCTDIVDHSWVYPEYKIGDNFP